MWNTINIFLKAVDDFVWGVPLMVLIMAGGIMLTVRLGLLQMRKLPLALKWMVKNEEGGDGEITSFGALCADRLINRGFLLIEHCSHSLSYVTRKSFRFPLTLSSSFSSCPLP